jgi:hypothetical protein
VTLRAVCDQFRHAANVLAVSYGLKVRWLNAVAMAAAFSVNVIHLEACRNWPDPDFVRDDVGAAMAAVNRDLAVPLRGVRAGPAQAAFARTLTALHQSPGQEFRAARGHLLATCGTPADLAVGSPAAEPAL